MRLAALLCLAVVFSRGEPSLSQDYPLADLSLNCAETPTINPDVFTAECGNRFYFIELEARGDVPWFGVSDSLRKLRVLLDTDEGVPTEMIADIQLLDQWGQRPRDRGIFDIPGDDILCQYGLGNPKNAEIYGLVQTEFSAEMRNELSRIENTPDNKFIRDKVAFAADLVIVYRCFVRNTSMGFLTVDIFPLGLRLPHNEEAQRSIDIATVQAYLGHIVTYFPSPVVPPTLFRN